MERQSVQTLTEGSADLLPSGRLMLEEQNPGRLLLFSPTSTLVVRFINNDIQGGDFQLGWSRYIPPALGERAAEALEERDCEKRSAH
jgi:hypothetical protein